MARKKSSFARALKTHGPSRRSALHKWLLGQYESLADTLNGKAPDWVHAAAEAAAEGQTDANGRPPSPDTLRQMWGRVRRHVEKAEAAKGGGRAKASPARSRPQADWQPRVVAPRTSQPFAGQLDNHRRASPDDWLPRPISSQGAMALPSMDRQPVSEEEAEDRIAKLRRTFAERSGH